LVNGTGDELLAGARLAGDQDRRLRRGYLCDAFQDRPDRRRMTDDLLEHRRLVDFLAKSEGFLVGALLGLLPVVDVGSRRIPANDPPLRVEERVVVDEDPPVLPVAPAKPLLVAKGHRTRQRDLPFFAQSIDVLGMKDASPIVLGTDLLEGNA